MQNFLDYLNAKPLYYKEIDYTRVHKAYALLKPHINQPTTIHIIGTNGKGSTGRTLAHLIYQSQHSVMHYSSPHITHFNERIWIDGEDSSDAVLESAHQKLFGILGEEVSDGLTYFEYTTLLALVVGQACDYMILEAGLGGEYDATNVVSKDFTIITPIGLDHQDFLGDTIEAIATTKINSIEKQALLAIGHQKKVKVIAQKIATHKKAQLYDATELISTSQQKRIHTLGYRGYIADNITTALVALDILQIGYQIEHLENLELFGRFYSLTQNIIIDVGHNPLSAIQIAKNLGDKKVVLIYNTLEDKDYKEILTILKSNIKRVEIMPLDGVYRALEQTLLEASLAQMKIEYQTFENLHPDEEYLVYGSFHTVESFLKLYNETFVA